MQGLSQVVFSHSDTLIVHYINDICKIMLLNMFCVFFLCLVAAKTKYQAIFTVSSRPPGDQDTKDDG